MFNKKELKLKILEVRISDQEKNFLDNRKFIQDLQLEIEKLKTHINSLRGLFNRKFAPGATSETIKSDPHVDGLDQLRKDVNPNP